jgi:hypothetical protein
MVEYAAPQKPTAGITQYVEAEELLKRALAVRE